MLRIVGKEPDRVGADQLSFGVSEFPGYDGIYPGDQLRLLRKAPLGGPLLVECNEREIALGRGIADKIIVE